MVTQVVPFWLTSKYLIIVIEIITHNWIDEIIKNSPCYAYPTISIHIYALGSILITKKEYSDRCIFLIKRALVNQQSSLLILKDSTFHTIWIYKFFRQRLFLPLYNTYPTWLSSPSQINWIFMLSTTKLIRSRMYDEPERPTILQTKPFVYDDEPNTLRPQTPAFQQSASRKSSWCWQ